MSYHGSKGVGMGADSIIDILREGLSPGSTGTSGGITFNSSKYPGVCKPSDVSTLSKFKALQSQLNRVAQAKGLPKIAVDGDIGPGTIALMAKCLGTDAGLSCTIVSPMAAVYTANAKVIADAASVPSSVPGPVAKAPSIVNAAGMETMLPPSAGASIMDTFTGMSTTQKVALVGLLGAAGYLAFGKKKRRK